MADVQLLGARQEDRGYSRIGGITPGLAQAYLGQPPDLFAGLSDDERRLALAVGRVREFPHNGLVFGQGAHHEYVFVVQSGIVRTFYTAPNGREITLAYWQVGNLVGTPEVLGSGVHQWSGIAVGQTEALAFRSCELRSLIERIPALAIGMIEALEFKGKCFSIIVQMLGTMNVSERLIQLLRTLKEVYGVVDGDTVVIKAPFTHEAIARMVGASRQWVTTELNNLQARGLVRLGKRSLIILRPDLIP